MPRHRTDPTVDFATLQAIAAQAAQLKRSERQELIAILQAYNEAEEIAEQQRLQREQRKQAALDRKGLRGGSGSFEDKFIRGYGPYRYLRYWYGKTHKSVYLGKVRSEPD
jgi:hypothetical protein